MKSQLLTSILMLMAGTIMAQANVRITHVDSDTHEVTLTNLGNAAQNVGTWNLCYFPDYDPISSMVALSGTVNLNPGASITVIWPYCRGNDGEIGLYINAANFGLVANMRDYMEWGSAGHTRETVAVSGGYWFTGDFVPNDPDFTFTGTGTDHGDNFWTHQTLGCTYASACNYNPLATKEDGTCEFTSCLGCTYPFSTEYDPAATIDDGSCSEPIPNCPADLNGDLVITTPDLLIFLGAFGTSCP
ncbi:MAG: hypothetical protein JNM00_04775 [Flavobacteriales bacterium]|nr:hypothetical protein [Flavobacteriales bacterium]